MSYLAGQRMTGVTRVRKLAAIRKLFTFMEENGIIAGNPANAVKGARREEKEPGILYSALANQAAEGRPESNRSKASRGNCTNSGSGAEFTQYRARQRCRRTKAKPSAKVGSAL
jgi:site-specific recombinase XerD